MNRRPLACPSAALALLLPALLAAAGDDEPRSFRPEADSHGVLSLPADRATLSGSGLERTDEPAAIAIVGWGADAAKATWEVDLPRAGRFQVLLEYAATGPASSGGTRAEATLIVVGDEKTPHPGPLHATGGTDEFLPQPLLGAISLPAGKSRLVLRMSGLPRGLHPAVRRVRLVPAEEADDGPPGGPDDDDRKGD